LGAVAGIALQIALERCSEISHREIRRSELRSAREIVALNSVRGARPIVRLDGLAVGDGKAGPWSQRFAETIASA
jgi:branched-subunit amino acid aminotransferase/4-amino-4-deoxychorismate lyase